MASDLSSEGSRVHKEWLRDYFRLPYTLRPILTERMPNFYMTDDEIELLIQYIFLVLVKDEISTLPVVENETERIEEGKIFKGFVFVDPQISNQDQSQKDLYTESAVKQTAPEHSFIPVLSLKVTN